MMHANPDAVRAILAAMLGVAGLSGMDAVAKNLGPVFPAAQIVFFRFTGTAIWLALFVWLTGRSWPKTKYLKLHALRAVLMCLTSFFFFYGVTHLPLAIATALAMSAPIYVALLGILVLKEPAHRSIGGAIVLGIAGSLIIVFAGREPVSATGEPSALAWTAAVLAPISYAAGIVLLKWHSANEGAAAITLAQAAMSGLIAFPFALPGFVVPEADRWLEVILLGVLGAAGYLLFIAALRSLPASVFSVVDYSALLWAALYGYVIFGEVPDASLWIGGALIIAACLLGMQVARRPRVVPTPPDGLPALAPERRSSSES